MTTRADFKEYPRGALGGKYPMDRCKRLVNRPNHRCVSPLWIQGCLAMHFSSIFFIIPSIYTYCLFEHLLPLLILIFICSLCTYPSHDTTSRFQCVENGKATAIATASDAVGTSGPQDRRSQESQASSSLHRVTPDTTSSSWLWPCSRCSGEAPQRLSKILERLRPC